MNETQKAKFAQLVKDCDTQGLNCAVDEFNGKQYLRIDCRETRVGADMHIDVLDRLNAGSIPMLGMIEAERKKKLAA